MRKRSSTRKNADPNLLAKSILDAATSEEQPEAPIDPVKAAAAALGRLGGLKGGKARAKNLSKTERAAIARKAARRGSRRLLLYGSPRIHSGASGSSGEAACALGSGGCVCGYGLQSVGVGHRGL